MRTITSDQQILDRVQRIIAEVLRIPVEQVTSDSLLGENLGAESLDFVDIQFRLETDYEVEFYQGIMLD
jgi:acyl carrier protein